MSEKIVSLNPPQLHVLSRIRDGCPAGVYNDWSHRISASTLHNRGLAVVKGRGASWSATITDPGARANRETDDMARAAAAAHYPPLELAEAIEALLLNVG